MIERTNKALNCGLDLNSCIDLIIKMVEYSAKNVVETGFFLGYDAYSNQVVSPLEIEVGTQECVTLNMPSREGVCRSTEGYLVGVPDIDVLASFHTHVQGNMAPSPKDLLENNLDFKENQRYATGVNPFSFIFQVDEQTFDNIPILRFQQKRLLGRKSHDWEELSDKFYEFLISPSQNSILSDYEIETGVYSKQSGVLIFGDLKKAI